MRTFVLAAAFIGIGMAAIAQEAKPAVTSASATKPAAPAASAQSSDPQATSATYGDWVLVCQRTVESARLCEISQTVQVQGQSGPIAQIAISKGAAVSNVTVVLPANITVATGPRLMIDEKDPTPVTLPWVRCLPGGCFATTALKPEVLAKWRLLEERGRLEFKDGVGRPIALPFSFRGIGVAYDALGKQ